MDSIKDTVNLEGRLKCYCESNNINCHIEQLSETPTMQERDREEKEKKNKEAKHKGEQKQTL